MLKKLKMLDSGPNKNYRKGQVIEVDEVRAKILLKGGHAEDPTRKKRVTRGR